MKKIAKNLTELIGNTPLVELNNFSKENNLLSNIVAKLESFNPLSSVKDRLGLALINDGIERGLIKDNTIIVEPTSGNTGIALAFVCASLGYSLILTMPDTMSIERRKILSALGAKIVLTEGAKGMKGAIEKAEEIIKSTDANYYMPQQFNNMANPIMHKKTTAMEILRDTEGEIDYFVAGIGTGGTITGVGEVLKEYNPAIKIIAIEPASSPVLSGGSPSPHKIQGIGAGFVPQILNTKVYDEVIQVTNEQAFEASRAIAKAEGILVGISSGAALFGAMQIAKREKDKKIIVLLPDTGERYLSTTLFD